MPGMFIAIEGIDGSGKGTLAKALANRFFEEGKTVVLTEEPYSERYGREIRLLLHRQHPPAVHLAQLYVQDRWAHIETAIKPALFAANIVVSKRYMYSTLAYQQAQGLPFANLLAMHAGFLKPDVTFILDVAPETALHRIKRHADHETFEQQSFLRKVRKNYLALPDLLPKDRFIILDASKHPADVLRVALGELTRIMKELEVFA